MTKQILKRLELIKTSIELDDEEIIELQILKLKKLECDDVVKNILFQLEELDYSHAILNIKKYLTQYSGVVVYVDEELKGLRLELKSLEEKLQKLYEKKTQYLNDIDEFNRQYYVKLGPLIEEILQLKQEMLKKELLKKKEEHKETQDIYKNTEETIDELKQKSEELDKLLEDLDEDEESYEEMHQIYEELQENIEELEESLKSLEEKLQEQEDNLDDEEFTQAKTDYEEFHSEYEQIEEENKQIFEISEDEKKELKKLYRKASRLCHPDIVVDALKEQANEIMQALNAVYAKKDLQGVKKILDNLEKGMAFEIASDTIEDKDLLRAKIEEFREKLTNIIQETDKIKKDDTFKLISELEDWDEYFDQVFEQLQEEKNSYSSEQQVVSSQPTKESVINAEKSEYSDTIKSIEIPNFEKIRRVCNNLVKSDKADNMQEYLAHNGKMHKAFVYDALEQFINQLNSQTIDIVDWGCKQGISSMLVLDYIREKQLNIEVNRVILLDKDANALKRAIVQVDALNQNSSEIIGLEINQSNPLKNLTFKNNILHLFTNDQLKIDFDNSSFAPENYVICLSQDNESFGTTIYNKINSYSSKSDIISDRYAKVGRFKKYEMIFKVRD